MKEILARRKLRSNKQVWTAEEFLTHLGAILQPMDWPRVPVVRLYPEPRRDTGERQNVAEVFVYSDPTLRMRLYAAQNELFERGDWFVVVRGEWLSSALQAQHVRRAVPHAGSFRTHLRGEPISVAPAGLPGESCFRVALSSGQSVLLDLGNRERPVEAASSDVAAFLSHHHPDHTGALRWALAHRLPLFLSDTTLRVLDATGKLQGTSSAELAWLRPVADGTAIESEGVSVRQHRIPHCIGSVAWSFCGKTASLLYTGDVMLRSRAYGFDWRSDLRAIVGRLEGRVTVLLEAARAHVATSADEEFLWPEMTALPQDVVVVGDNAERLLFSYVQAYARVFRPRPDTSPMFVLTPDARRLLQACWSEVFHSDKAHPDVPFVKTRDNKWGVAESHALYWLDRVDARALARLDRQRLWFVDRSGMRLLPQSRHAVI